MLHSSLLGPVISYEEDKALQIQLQGPHSQHFILLITFKWAQQARVLLLGKALQPRVMLHNSSLGPFISYEENEAL